MFIPPLKPTKQVLPHARVTETDAGHFIQEEEAEKIAEAIVYVLGEIQGFCMIRLTDSGIDSCCSKLTKNDLKGLVKVPCAYRGHTKYGSRSGQVTKGHGFHFLLHGRATHVLWLIFHAESDGNGYM